MSGPMRIPADRIAVWPRETSFDLWSVPHAEVTETLRALAEDMEAAAVDTGDQAPAGSRRQFAAARAVRADEIRRTADHPPLAYIADPDEEDEEEEESPW
jgi:hypothetical protein